MQITRACDYACRALMYLLKQGSGSVETARVAQESDIPPVYLRKIFQSLSRAGIVRTSPGTGGGVALARPADKITLKEIVEALEGPITLSECISRPETCKRSSTCTVRANLTTVQNKLTEEFASRRLSDLT